VAALTALLLLSALAVFALPVGRRPLANQDEARFALLAREAVESHHWLLPRVRGVIYLNKPPLYFWTVALLAKPFGVVNDVTAPIASVLAALVTLLAVIALGRRLWDESIGLAAALVLARRGMRVVVLERDSIPESATPEEAFDRSVDVHVSRLRHKLGDDPKSPRMLKTVRGAGYMLATETD